MISKNYWLILKNQPVPDANYYQNIDPNVQTLNLGVSTINFESLIVTGQSNLYNVSRFQLPSRRHHLN